MGLLREVGQVEERCERPDNVDGGVDIEFGEQCVESCRRLNVFGLCFFWGAQLLRESPDALYDFEKLGADLAHEGLTKQVPEHADVGPQSCITERSGTC